ncbi:hypothetical protein BXZ70DRAFT_648263 [Cristinia sonorae]|uniref:Uncharacterized protein n=1 Tax=Cristinia sonorae TaxID=1940300 RepID=A0A8K0UES1_9AGAR|nr:hypothetical protein BXZ70DRAFT_648263 [Cristinia sonorae]
MGLTVPELIELIIDHLSTDKPTLSTLSTVSSLFLPRSRFHLFRTIYLIIHTADPNSRNIASAVRFFTATPHVCSSVRHVHIRAAQTMRMEPEGRGEVGGGFWPIPQSGADVQELSALLNVLSGPLSLDMEGVYMSFNVPTIDVSALLPTVRIPSVRKLTFREVLIPPHAFTSMFNLTNIFTALEDLSLVNMLFDAAVVVAGIVDPPPWGGDLTISKLLLRHVSGLLGLLPSSAFRNVRSLDMPMLSLLIPDAARFLTPLYDTLEHLTLAVGQFGLNDIARNAFDLGLCTRLRSLTFVQVGKHEDPDMASLFLLNVNACLRLAPPAISDVTVALLPYSELTIQVVLAHERWRATREILGGFEQLKEVRVVVMRDCERHPRELGEREEYEMLSAASRDSLAGVFGKEFNGKLRCA